MKKPKCVMENINVKKSKSAFLGIRILRLIPVYPYQYTGMKVLLNTSLTSTSFYCFVSSNSTD